jgi:hypothetical protein
MGLDITALSKIRVEDHNMIKLKELLSMPVEEEKELYTFTENQIGSANNWIKDMEPGRYFKTEETEEFDFRAGSYSGYGEYRMLISECFLGVTPRLVWENPKKYEGMPFYEQVDFSDCEGFIGPAVSAKLAKDYREGKDQWIDYIRSKFDGMVNYDHYIQKYDAWTKAFELASDNGIVWFA